MCLTSRAIRRLALEGLLLGVKLRRSKLRLVGACVVVAATGAAWKLLAVARVIERPSVDALPEDEAGLKAKESVLEDVPAAATAARTKLAVIAALTVGGERRETKQVSGQTARVLLVLRSTSICELVFLQ